MNAKTSDRFIALAAIAQPHGVHGRVKLKLFTESLDSFSDLCPHLTDESGKPVSLRITGESAGLPVAEIDIIRDRNIAEQMRGTLLGVPRSLLPETDNGEYYHEDLIGLRAINAETGDDVGTITAVDNFGAGDIITICDEAKNDSLLPLNDDTFTEIDIHAGTATVQLPEITQAKPDKADAT